MFEEDWETMRLNELKRQRLERDFLAVVEACKTKGSKEEKPLVTLHSQQNGPCYFLFFKNVPHTMVWSMESFVGMPKQAIFVC